MVETRLVYVGLRLAGKSPKTALIAVTRKLVVTLNAAIVRESRDWCGPQRAASTAPLKF